MVLRMKIIIVQHQKHIIMEPDNAKVPINRKR